MKYKLLSSMSYKNKEQYLEEYGKRIGSQGTILFPIEIKGSQSFIVSDWEITSLIETIGRYNSKAIKIFSSLFENAKEYYIRKCLMDEIQMTNDIEGVHSSKREIRIALKSGATDKLERFEGMAKKYEKLLKGETLLVPLKTGKDIRDLYDEIVSAEITKDNILDGKLFREHTVFVVSPNQQTKHEGVGPEDKIIETLEAALTILDMDALPMLVRIAIFHYFFGYIHPFYDGNGRVSRFISSYLLNKGQYQLLALELSHTIKENRSTYHKAFQICNEKKNKGDITPFVIIFLEFIRDAAKRMCDNLEDGYNRLKAYSTIINEKLFIDNKKKDRDHKRNLLFYFIQNALFAIEPFSVEELTGLMKCSRISFENLLKDLIREGYPIVKSKEGKWNRYFLNLEKFDGIIENI